MSAGVVFTIGSAIQAGAVNVPMIFAGRAIAGIAIGILTMVVPLYMAEVSLPEIRGGIVVLQQLAITPGILFSVWIDYGTNYISGTRCTPDMPFTGRTSASPSFDPQTDVCPQGCTGQSDASWRVPFSLQILPGLLLGIGMFFFPESPRWLVKQDRNDEAIVTLSKLRRQPPDDPVLLAEYVEIRAEVAF
jgi:MFS family permease